MTLQLTFKITINANKSHKNHSGYSLNNLSFKIQLLSLFKIKSKQSVTTSILIHIANNMKVFQNYKL